MFPLRGFVNRLIATAHLAWARAKAFGAARVRPGRAFPAWILAPVVGASMAVGSAVASTSSTKALMRLEGDTVTTIEDWLRSSS